MRQYSLHRRRAFFMRGEGINAESNIAARHASVIAWARNRAYLRRLSREESPADAPRVAAAPKRRLRRERVPVQAR